MGPVLQPPHSGHWSPPWGPNVGAREHLWLGMESVLSPALVLLPPPPPPPPPPLPAACAWLASWPWSSSGHSLPCPVPRASLHTYWCACCSSCAAGRVGGRQEVTLAALSPLVAVSTSCAPSVIAPSVCPNSGLPLSQMEWGANFFALI